MRFLHGVFAALLFVVSFAASPSASAAPPEREPAGHGLPQLALRAVQYTLFDLGMLPGYQQSTPAAINADDVVVTTLCCAAGTAGNTAPGLYVDGHLWNLGSVKGFAAGSVAAVNAAGLAVGTLSQTAPTGSWFPARTQAVAYTKSGVRMLGALPGYPLSVATGVNDAGDAIGYSQSLASTSVTLFHNGRAIRLGDGYGAGINNAGVAIGTDLHGKAAIYSVHGMRELGAFAAPRSGSYSYGTAINDRGVAVGYSGYPIALWPNFFQHAFVADATGLRDLGVPDGVDFRATQTTPYAINNRTEIVGYYVVVANGIFGIGRPSAFIYTAGKMYDLNGVLPPGSGWSLVSATGINDCGDIVGQGTHDGVARAFLLERHRERSRATAAGCPVP